MTKMIGGRAQHGADTYDGTHTGTILLTGANAVAISATSVGCFNVFVQASTLNTALVLVGNNKQGCTIELAAGAGITVEINDVEKIMARPVSVGQRVNWMAMI